MALPALGFSTWAFPGEVINRSIDHALSHQFNALEVALLDSALFGQRDILPSDHQAREVARRTDGIRLTVHAPIVQVSVADLESEVRERSVETLRRTIRAAYEMHAEVVVFHLSRRDPEAPAPTSWREDGILFAAEHVHSLGLIAAEMGIVLAVENVGFSARAADRDYSQLSRIIDQISLDNVGICFDVGHAHFHSSVCGGVDASAALFGPRVRHYHVHDNDGTADQHVRVGAGTVNYRLLLPAWTQGYKGVIAMEVFNYNEANTEIGTLNSRATLESLFKGIP